MKKVIIMRGLPGSGKSTYAKNLVTQYPNAYKRINRDDLRAMFDNTYRSKGNEKFVKKIRDVLIIEALRAGKHVIVDDTNLSDKNITRIQQLVGQFNKANGENVTVEIKEMTTSLAECIKRDRAREQKVGEKVIRQMYRQMGKKERYAVQDATLPKAIICDLDGTLAIIDARNPYDATNCEEVDELNQPVANVLTNYQQLGYKILLVSGRSDLYQPQTIRWLAKHAITYDLLLMRPQADKRKDSIYKTDIYEQHIQHQYFVEFVLDDRNQVVAMWRDELQLPCFQVYYGDF